MNSMLLMGTQSTVEDLVFHFHLTYFSYWDRSKRVKKVKN